MSETEAHYEVTETETDRDKLALAFWAAVGERSASNDVYPTTLPDDFAFDDETPDDDARIADDTGALDMADRVHKAVTGQTGSGLSAPARRRVAGRGDDVCVFVVPEWFAKDEWGVWNAVFIGRFKGDTKSGGAWKVENIIEWSDRGEDDYFLNPIEFSTVPKSLCTVFTGTREAVATGVTFERGLDSSNLLRDRDSDPREADVSICGVKQTQYGMKVVLDFEPPWGNEAEHEAIKAVIDDFTWETAHATFDGDDWTMDPAFTPRAIDELTEQGFSVGVCKTVREFVRDNVDPTVVEGFEDEMEVEF